MLEIAGQTFSWTDLPRVFALMFLEIALSSDNAIVLGLLVHSLAASLRRRALYVGVISAVVLRALALLGVSYFFQYRWVCLLGALYLLYLCFRHFSSHREIKPKSTTSFWKTVILIEVFDLAFALDSILAALAFIQVHEGPSYLSKLWIVYVGGIFGLMGVRYAADVFSQMLGRFPRLPHAAHLMVGWVGAELAVNTLQLAIPYGTGVYWTVLAGLFLYGFSLRR